MSTPAPARSVATAPTSSLPTWFMAAALVAVAANLRVAIATVPPLVDRISSELGLSHAWIGALTTLPVLCMGLFAPVAQRLSVRFGPAVSIWLAVATLGAGSLLRGWSGHVWTLYLGTFAAGVGIAVAGTLLPRLVKAVFPPERTGAVTGLYMLAMMGGAAAASAVAVPLAGLLGSWQASLASWSLLALLGLLAWAPMVARERRHRATVSPADQGHGLPWRSPTAWLVAGYLASQSWAFYSSLAWIAPAYVDRGWDPAVAGYLLSAYASAQVLTGLLAPAMTDHIGDRRLLLLPAAVLGLAGLLGLLLAPDLAPWLWVVVLGLGQGAAFSLALVLLVDYAETAAGSGRLAAMTFLISYSIASCGPLVMGAVRDAADGFGAIWLILSLLMLVQIAFVLMLRPGLPRVR